MLKFLLITILIFYIIYRLGGFVFRMLFSNAFQQQRNFHEQQRQQYYQHQAKTPPNSNVKVDYVPKDKERKEKQDFKGGQYVDYEEVK